jgi:hypothetical protein
LHTLNSNLTSINQYKNSDVLPEIISSSGNKNSNNFQYNFGHKREINIRNQECNLNESITALEEKKLLEELMGLELRHKQKLENVKRVKRNMNIDSETSSVQHHSHGNNISIVQSPASSSPIVQDNLRNKNKESIEIVKQKLAFTPAARDIRITTNSEKPIEKIVKISSTVISDRIEPIQNINCDQSEKSIPSPVMVIMNSPPIAINHQYEEVYSDNESSYLLAFQKHKQSLTKVDHLDSYSRNRRGKKVQNQESETCETLSLPPIHKISKLETVSDRNNISSAPSRIQDDFKLPLIRARAAY